jgi:catechol 2,3-dioxygenase-like lactoylglutathione lyase family enzyme
VKLSQVRLLVDDTAAAFRFYRDELGLTPGFGLVELFQSIPMAE